MINKIFKNIHNKYSNFFNFFFFLRYLFGIFFIATILFLSIPKFFDYDNRQKIIKEYLINNYDLEITNYSLIEYKIFPLPNISIENVNLKIKKTPINLNTKQFKLFLNFKSIYDYSNFEANKLLLDKNVATLDIDKIGKIINHFTKIKNKIDVQDLNLELKRKSELILKIKNINFSNYGHKRNKIKGRIFDKNFEANIKKDKIIDFEIIDTGIKANFVFDKMENLNATSGSSKINILNNYLKVNFKTQNNQVEIQKSNLKNKYFSINFESIIKFYPYFEINSDININKIDKKILESLNFEKIIQNHEILKKFNSRNKVNYKKKRPGNNLIKNFNSQFELSHGRLIYDYSLIILGGKVSCEGDSLLIEEYPRLNFNCTFNINDKNKILKKFSISKKTDQNPLRFKAEGSLNLLNKKINLDLININENNITKEEDINFFKVNFEKILFDESFLKIFKIKKFKEFILEII